MTVKIRFQMQFVMFAILSFSTSVLPAQDTVYNRYRLWVIKDVKTYLLTVSSDDNKQMLDIKKKIPGIVMDLRYATPLNFLHKKLYPQIKTSYARMPAVMALQRVQNELEKMGMGLKIYDAYRPYSVTEKMWEPVKDDRYVADPKKGSGHNRGTSVDVTLINIADGKEFNMGTGYDDFSDTAHHSFKKLPAQILQNREILKKVMENNGFVPLETEWWHYSLPDAKKYELLDLKFKELNKIQER